MNPNIIPAHHLLGSVYSKLDDTKNAISSYQRVLQLSPKDVNAHYNLACIYQKQDEKELAEQAFSRVIELSPELENDQDLRKCLAPVK